MKIILFIFITLSILATCCNLEKVPPSTNNFTECYLTGPVEIDSTISSSGDLYGKFILTLQNAVDTFYYPTDLADTTVYPPFSQMGIRIVQKDSVERTGGIIDRTNLNVCMIIPGKKYDFHFMAHLMEGLHIDSMYFYFMYSKTPDMENRESFEVGMKVK